ncbi:MAG: PEP-CTERM sorting domain-containing protein [Armatimonadota bacterium]
MKRNQSINVITRVRVAISVTLGVGLVLGVQGQTAVPTAFATSSPLAAAGGSSTANVFSSANRTVQFQIAASELSYFTVNTPLKAINFRATSQATPLFQADSFADWTLTFAQARNAVGSMSATFANNMLDPVVVRTGGLSLPANAYPGNAVAPAVNPWGFEIKFTTPYIYKGGDLVIMLSHTPSTSTSSIVLDSFSPPNAAGYGTKYQALSATSYNATTASNLGAAFPAMQIVPEPASMAAIGLGIAGLMRRRKRTA